MENTTERRRRYRRKRRRNRRKRRVIKRGIWLFMILLVCYAAGRYIIEESPLKKHTKNELIEAGYPESLAELYVRNEETRDFVMEYPNYQGREENIDIGDELQQNKIPLFLQWDQRWGYEKYGDDFMAVTGCGPTALSMVYCGLTGDGSLHPLTMAELAQENGYYVEGSGTSWNVMTELAERIGLSVWKPAFSEESILSELQEGHPIICIMGPGDFTTTGHFIVLTGIKNGKIVVNDPNSLKNSDKLWEIDVLMKQIRDLWAYS